MAQYGTMPVPAPRFTGQYYDELYNRNPAAASGGMTYNPYQVQPPTYNAPSIPTPPAYTPPKYQGYEVGGAPAYTGPKWDESEISNIAQKRAAPGLRAMRQQMNRVSGMSADNPNVKRMTLRDALQGYGTGLSQVMGEASAAAVGEYSRKYGYEADALKTNYTGQMAGWEARNRAKEQETQQGFVSNLEAAKMNWGASVEQQNAQTAARADASKINFGVLYDKWKRDADNYEKQAQQFATAPTYSTQTSSAKTYTIPTSLSQPRVSLGRA